MVYVGVGLVGFVRSDDGDDDDDDDDWCFTATFVHAMG